MENKSGLNATVDKRALDCFKPNPTKFMMMMMMKKSKNNFLTILYGFQTWCLPFRQNLNSATV
jgi:hypothetical protein